MRVYAGIDASCHNVAIESLLSIIKSYIDRPKSQKCVKIRVINRSKAPHNSQRSLTGDIQH